MSSSYNLRNPAVKRLMKEAAELREPTELYSAQPMEDNLFEWHFTVRGPPDTDFQGGLYHGRISLPPQYPMKPPTIMLLTPNGRFETNRKICLSISGHHPESWQPSWSIRTALLAIIGFMPTHGAGAIGALDYTPTERRALAAKSTDWRCNLCNASLKDVLPPLTEASKSSSQEAMELAAQINFKDETETEKEKKALESAAAERGSGDGAGASSRAGGEGAVEGVGERVGEEGSGVVRERRRAEGRVVEVVGRVDEESGLGSSLLISLISLAIALLVFRRLYILNEWRFYPTPQ